MGFQNSIEIASAGMSAQRRRLEVIAANLANVKTTSTPEGGPYRKKMVVFKSSVLDSSSSGSFSGFLRNELRSVKVDNIYSDTSPPQQVFEPDHPDADNNGYVFYPNINPIDEMVNMLGAARSYEANLEVLKSVKRLSVAALELANV